MAKAGKGLLRAEGTQVLSDEGKLVGFNSLGESCCCDIQPPDPENACPIQYWGQMGLPPDETSLYPIDLSLEKLPRCITWTLEGGAFAGSYELVNRGGGSYDGRYAITASEDTQFNGWESGFAKVAGFERVVSALYAGCQYNVHFRISLQLATSSTTKTSEFNLQGVGWNGEYDTNLVAAQSISIELAPSRVHTNLEGWNPAIMFDGVPFYDQNGMIKDIYPVDGGGSFVGGLYIEASDVSAWTSKLDLTSGGEGVSAFTHDNHECECFHERYINSWEQRIYYGVNTAIDSTWRSNFGTSQGFYTNNAVEVVEGTGFGDVPSLSILSGTGQHSRSRNGAIEPLSVSRKVPWHDGQGIIWECSFDTSSFVRKGQKVAGGSQQGGFFPCIYEMRELLPVLDTNVVIRRHLECQADQFGSNPNDDVEMISYWTIDGFGVAHTAPVPSGYNGLIPDDTCLPNTTTIRYERLWVSPESSGAYGRPTYRVKLYVNNLLLIDMYDEGGLEWPTGDYDAAKLFIDNTSVYNGTACWEQFTEGFDDKIGAGLFSTTLTPTTNTQHHAPPYCPSIPPALLVTPQGEIDLISHDHSITFHINEDIGTHQFADLNGTLTPPLYRRFLFGDLPVGLTLNGYGVMSGTPTALGSSSIYCTVIDYYGMTCNTWTLNITVKVRDPAFQYDPNGFVSGGTNTEGVDWYMRDGDSGTIEADAHWGTTPYVMSYTGDALDGASFNTSTGDWVLNPAHTQVGNTSGTVTMKLLDDTNKTDFVTKTWFRLGS